MSDHDLSYLYGTESTSKPWTLKKAVLMSVFAFFLGLVIFPLGIALGFHYYEHHKKQSYAAFSGVLILILFVAVYIIINWWDIMSLMRSTIG